MNPHQGEAPQRAIEKNQRVVVSRHGDPGVLQVIEEAMPVPRPGEVRVRMLAAGVSAFDLIYRRWARLPGSPKIPFTLGEDIVGVVDELGPGVTEPQPGQCVAAGTWSLGIGGGYTEHLCLPADQLVDVPDGVDPVEAAAVVVNYLTAHQHLNEIAHVRPGERILVHGAAGGVGTALVQLSILGGLEVYGTASTDHLDLVSALGATPIDYRRDDFLQRIRDLAGNGVDVVVDPVGGAQHLWRSYRALRRGGRLVWLGSAAVKTQGLRVGPLSMLTLFLLRLIPDHKRVPRCPLMPTYAMKNNDWYHQTLGELLADLSAGRIRPVIDARFPLTDAVGAHELLEHGRHAGKIVLVPADEDE